MRPLASALALTLAAGAGMGVAACTDDAPPTEQDPGSLCACLEVDGVEECCFGHGECVEQPEGPDRCVCDTGGRGDTCSTPPPGVHAVRPRSCVGDDPGCAQVYSHVVVESFDACTDLEQVAFESTIVRPAADASGAWPPGDPPPVAVLTHGASQDPADYFDLLEHLAANGIVAAAFDGTPGQDIGFRANRTLSYVECLRDEWADGDRISDRYALIGHSRGGAAVAIAAQAIADGLAAEGVSIDALVALAPTEAGTFAISTSTTPAYLAVQGSRDPDTLGAALGWFDEAGEGDPGFVRASAWVFGATHHRFHQGLLFAGTGEQQASLSSPGHWTVARAYIGGFLVWRLLGRDDHRPVFVGEAIPNSVVEAYDGAPQVFAGLDDGAEARLVVHDFAGASLSPSNLGGAVEAVGFTAAEIGAVADLDAPWSRAHRTSGLRLDGAGSLTIEVPVEIADVQAFSALSLRLARTFDGDPERCDGPGPGPANDITLRLHHASSQEPAVVALADIGEGGRVEPPDRLVPETFGNWTTADCHALDFLRPIRVPLQRFCADGLDPASVEAIELRVEGPSTAGLLVADVQFERGEGEPAACE